MSRETPEQAEERRFKQLEDYHSKRESYIKEMGGKCSKCGTNDNLEFDHIDRFDKDFDVSTKWTKAKKEMFKELQKCQLLCESCHMNKSILERGQTPAKGTHGTLSSYRYCRCDVCKLAKRIHTYESKYGIGSYNKIQRNIKNPFHKSIKESFPDKYVQTVNMLQSGKTNYRIRKTNGLSWATIQKIRKELNL